MTVIPPSTVSVFYCHCIHPSIISLLKGQEKFIVFPHFFMIATINKMASRTKKEKPTRIKMRAVTLQDVIRELISIRQDLALLQDQLIALEDKVDQNYLEQNPPSFNNNFKATL